MYKATIEYPQPRLRDVVVAIEVWDLVGYVTALLVSHTRDTLHSNIQHNILQLTKKADIHGWGVYTFTLSRLGENTDVTVRVVDTTHPGYEE